MKHFSLADLAVWDRFTRANFVNSLSGFKSASLIASQDKDQNLNLAIFSNIVHLGADPALIAFVNRPREAAPHTLRNIESTEFYTINHIAVGQIAQAHQTSAKYPDGVNEFEAVGLSPVYQADFPVPFVAGSPVQYAMKLEQIIPITLNNTFLVIGSLQHAFVDPAVMDADGFLNLDVAGSVASLGLSSYYETNLVGNFPYARPAVK
jgi:flavin reductase (DIM6/NTAB) family NADH-FMN oxidoreductase RutF